MPDYVLQPTIYRLLHFQPDCIPLAPYGEQCSKLLKACGNSSLDFEALLEVYGGCLTTMLDMTARGLELKGHVLQDADQTDVGYSSRFSFRPNG